MDEVGRECLSSPSPFRRLQQLIDIGVTGFCWLAPSEQIPGLPGVENYWPDGGFVYFYDDEAEPPLSSLAFVRGVSSS